MTFNIHASTNNQPVGNVLVFCNVLETGQVFMRSTDGNGYANLAINPTHGYPLHVVLYTQDPRFENWVQPNDALPNVDQEVSIPLIPFVG